MESKVATPNRLDSVISSQSVEASFFLPVKFTAEPVRLGTTDPSVSS